MWQWTWSTLVYVTKSLPESMEQQTLPEPVLTDRQRCSMAFTWELFQKCPWTSSVICVRRSHFLNYYHISQGQWVKLYTSGNAYLRIHHSAYWCPGAKAPAISTNSVDLVFNVLPESHVNILHLLRTTWETTIISWTRKRPIM